MHHRMAFYLSGKVAGSHLDKITAIAYLCNQAGTVYLLHIESGWRSW